MRNDRIRLMIVVLVIAVLAGACGGGGGGGGSDEAAASTSTSSVTLPAGPLRQELFHDETVNAVRLFFGDRLIPDRFAEEKSSIRIVDITRGEVEFKTRRDIGEFAREHGLLGFGGGDFVASGGVEFWGIITYVFRAADGARSTFERFPDPETVSIDDAARTDAQTRPFRRGGATGTLAVDTYTYEDGTRSLVLRIGLVDENVVHYVSAIVDVAPEQILDGFGELERVAAGLQGVYRVLFQEFLKLGGVDAPTTTTTRDPNFVPGGVPGNG